MTTFVQSIGASSGDCKFPIGATVYVEKRVATVTRHGHDSSGIYTEVKFADGASERVHRSMVKGCPICGGGHPVGCCAQDGHGG